MADTAPLTSEGLENALVAKVLAREPSRRPAGVDELLLRDMAMSVVREIVGTLEVLVDRMLTESKEYRLRTLVAELLSEDVRSLIAATNVELRRKEIKHLELEIERLHGDTREAQLFLEDRLHDMNKFRDSENERWRRLESRLVGLEDRMSRSEADLLPRDEFAEKMANLDEELSAARSRDISNETLSHELSASLGVLDAFCQKTYALKGDATDLEGRLNEGIEASRKEAAENLSALREVTFQKTDAAEFQETVDGNFQTVRQHFETSAAHIEQLFAGLKEERKYGENTYTNQAVFSFETQSITNRIEAYGAASQKAEQRLEDMCATKSSLQSVAEHAARALVETNARLEGLGSAHDGTRKELTALQEEAAFFATRDYADKTATEIATKLTLECDEKEEIEELRQEVRKAGKQLQRTTTQQQDDRKDFNDVIEELSSVRSSSLEFQKDLGKVTADIEQLGTRTEDMVSNTTVELANRKKVQSDLEALLTSLRADLEKQALTQTAEGKRAYELGTQRYFEQVDLALKIKSQVEKVESNVDKTLTSFSSMVRLPDLS